MLTKYDIHLFTDGSAGGKSDIGAWAAIACFGGVRKILYGIDCPTSISRCELRPIIEGLRYIKNNWCISPGLKVCVISDSEYTVKTLTSFFKINKNKDLWSAIPDVTKGMTVTFIWRERNTLPYMALCDEIAGLLRKSMIDHAKTMTQLDNNALPKWNAKKDEETMGLDMFLKSTPEEFDTEVDFRPNPDGCTEIHYWRKCNNLHGWFDELYRSKGGKDDDFNCCPIKLTIEDLDQLEEDLADHKHKLPPCSGFFWGSQSELSDDQIADIKEAITKARGEINNGKTVYYSAWY